MPVWSAVFSPTAVSFGPQMHDIHTSRERLDIASTARTWEYLVAVLERL